MRKVAVRRSVMLNLEMEVPMLRRSVRVWKEQREAGRKSWGRLPGKNGM